MKQTAVPSEVIEVYNNALEMTSRGKLDDALDEYRRAILMFPRFIEAYNNIGEIYSRLGDSASAIDSYNEALTISRNYRVLLNLGVEYYNEGLFEKALTLFVESIQQNPNFLEGNFYSGMAQFNLKNHNEAVSHFIKVVDFDRQHLKANYLLAYIYYSWKQYSKVLECLDRISNIADDKQFVNKYYGFCFYHLGAYDKAVSYLKDALKANPKYHQFKDYLDSLTVENKLKELGNITERISEMEEKVMKGDSKPTLREYSKLSMLYIFNGEYKKAEDLLVNCRDSYTH